MLGCGHTVCLTCLSNVKKADPKVGLVSPLSCIAPIPPG